MAHAGGMTAREIRGLLLDIDGVLTVSWRPLPGAVGSLAKLRDASIPFRLLTNTTELPRRDLVSILRLAGFAVEVDEIVTALVATGQFLRTRYAGARCLVIGGSDSREDLDGVAFAGENDAAEVVVVGGSSAAIPWEVANRALRLVLDGVPLVAMHGSLMWMTDSGIVLDTGRALVLALERAANVEATVIGKPSPEFFVEALDLLGLPAAEVAMVGDDLEGDVLAAQRLGIAGVLVRTGKFSQDELERSAERPQNVVDSFSDIPALLGLT
jgi:HAD superfamily hydrolase (TIGR01458 family)